MIPIRRLSSYISSDLPFVKTIIDSLPCGLFVVDEKGRVVAVNDITGRVFGTSLRQNENVDLGVALGCIHSLGTKTGCGLGQECEYCEARQLAFETFEENKKRRVRFQLPLLLDGEVRDASLLLSAVPCNFNRSRFCVLIIEDISGLRHIVPPDPKEGFRGLIGQHERILAVFQTVKEVAQVKAPVLIQGESGTGKELVALAIHKESPRCRKPFVPVNCGGLPESLLESELFGHVKGAFTGAVYDKKGRFSIADGGTIFLDEVGELSPATQVRLLRVLQDGKFEPVGSEKTVTADVRIISATNRDLRELVKARKFRQDLYYRLCVVPIDLPPLRARGQDIAILATHFLKRFCEDALRPAVALSPEALSVLENHTWPGNIRELQNVLQHALIKCRGPNIEPNHLPPLEILRKPKTPPHFRGDKLETTKVIDAIQKARGNKSRAAQMLGVSRSTLYRFLGDLHESS